MAKKKINWGAVFTCTGCGGDCTEESDTGLPKMVFTDRTGVVICENCSIDYEMKDGLVALREE